MPDFFQFIKSFEVFVLVETHVTCESTDKYTKYFGGLDIKWCPDSRTNRFGRASGGILISIKNSINNKEISYSDLQFLKNTLCSHELENLILMGDMNVRLGEMQQEVDDIYQKPSILDIRC